MTEIFPELKINSHNKISILIILVLLEHPIIINLFKVHISNTIDYCCDITITNTIYIAFKKRITLVSKMSTQMNIDVMIMIDDSDENIF